MNKIFNSLIWTLVFLILILIYSFQFEISMIFERVRYNLFPKNHIHNSSKKIIINQSLDGHFYINAKLDSTKIKFLIDTGASDIFISLNDAQLMNINIDHLLFTKRYSTANGITRAAPYDVELIEIGEIKIRNAKIYIGENYFGPSLLGMKLIGKLESFTIDNNLLIINY